MYSFDTDMLELKALMTDHGMRGALRWLQQRTQYRFTALRMLDGGQLKTLHLLDKQQTEYLRGVAADCMHYCRHVIALGKSIVVADALHDALAQHHPHRSDMRAYCGMPLHCEDGAVCGTICMLDTRPRQPAESELNALKLVGATISAALGQLAAPYIHPAQDR